MIVFGGAWGLFLVALVVANLVFSVIRVDRLSGTDRMRAAAIISAARREGRIPASRSDEEVMYDFAVQSGTFRRSMARFNLFWILCFLISFGVFTWASQHFYRDDDRDTYNVVALLFAVLGVVILLATPFVHFVRKRRVLKVPKY
jgi:hypothetical protein